MSEINTRTIIINGDDGWSFRDLVCCHALDLYPLDSGVDFFDVVATGAAEIGRDNRSYQSVIGNFPEDYSSEPDTLLEEIDETIARLATSSNRSTYLSLALVINKKDFEALAASRERDMPALSTGALNGYNALLRAMAAVEAQGDVDNPNVIGRMSTRVWFSLIIRDAGANSADLRAAEKVHSLVRLKRVGVQSLFFLSEGRGQDALERAPDRHFAKLRLLIDILSQSHTDAVQKNLQAENARDFSLDTSKFMWLRTKQAEAEILGNADMIRRDLVSRFFAFSDKESSEKQENWLSDFIGLKSKLNGILPGLKDADRSGDDSSDAYTEQTALDAVITASKNATAANRDQTQEGLDAEREITDISAALGRRKRSWLYSASAPKKITKLTNEYQSALTQARTVFGTSVSAEIDNLRVDIEHKRKDLHATLDVIKLPTTQDAVQDLISYTHDVLEDNAKTVNKGIVETRLKNEQIDAIESKTWEKMQEKRDIAINLLLQTENRLLRISSAFMVIGIVSIVAMVPILLVPFAQSLKGIAQFGSIQNVFGPMGIIMLFNVFFALIFAILLARRLAKKRNIALKQLRELMLKHYQDLKLSFAGLLRISVNRWRLSLLKTTIRFLRPSTTIRAQEPASQFISKLATMQSKLDEPVHVMSDKTLQVLEAAFQMGSTSAEKITSVLIANHAQPEDKPVLRIEPGHFGATEFTLETSASPQSLTLKLGSVGDE